MTWQQWFFVTYFMLNAFVMICIIGKPRKPLEAPAVAVACLMYVGYILIVLSMR